MQKSPHTDPAIASDRRDVPRFAVDEPATLFSLHQGSSTVCRMMELSVSGCRVRMDCDFLSLDGQRIELGFRVRGVAFRVGVTIEWSHLHRDFGLCFTNMSARRRDELQELLGELKPDALLVEQENGETASGAKQARMAEPATASAVQEHDRERRKHSRHLVNSSASILLIDVRSKIKGRILDVSLSGCRIRSEERFPVGIYRRVEVEFVLDGLPFHLGGVVQSVHDRFTVGIRFLDLSERKREQLTVLLLELEDIGLASLPAQEQTLPAICAPTPAAGALEEGTQAQS